MCGWCPPPISCTTRGKSSPIAARSARRCGADSPVARMECSGIIAPWWRRFAPQARMRWSRSSTVWSPSSSADWQTFLAALQQFEISLLIDVRSRPRSSRFPHFSQPELEQSLCNAGIRYLFLGEELGGRPDDPKVYREDGLVNYRARRKSRGFRAGLDRVLTELGQDTL